MGRGLSVSKLVRYNALSIFEQASTTRIVVKPTLLTVMSSHFRTGLEYHQDGEILIENL